MTRPRLDLAERNLRALVANGERSGAYVVSAYRQDLIDLLGELERVRECVSAPLATPPVRTLTVGAGRG